MGKNAYLVIPDLHLGNMITKNRINYRKEMIQVEVELMKIAARYLQNGYHVIALFLGDIFHNSYKDVTEALLDKDFITNWRFKIGEIYSVMGNHEFTYYKANPFYTLVHEIEADSVKLITNKVWLPLGATNVIRVVDTLIDGEVSFQFNHFGTGVHQSNNKVNIGLFHQELVDPQIRAEVESKLGKTVYSRTIDLDNSNILTQYDYCFFGHMHLLYGVWKSGNTYLCYLGSLGRTNETEVRDDFLERNIPVVLVDDGVFNRIEDNFITLMDRHSTINETVVADAQKRNMKAKELHELRNYIPLQDDPIQNVYEMFCEEPSVVRILDDLKIAETDTRLTLLRANAGRLNIGNF